MEHRYSMWCQGEAVAWFDDWIWAIESCRDAAMAGALDMKIIDEKTGEVYEE